jgi:hypothetical protein
MPGAVQSSLRLTLIANELAFDGVGSRFIATGSRYLQMKIWGFRLPPFIALNHSNSGFFQYFV